MLRVIRTDLYRLFRSKAFYVYPAFLVFLLSINTFFGPADEALELTMGWEDIIMCTYDETLLFMGIAFIIFVTCETRNGFVKNAVGCIKDRSYMVFSKILTGITIMVAYILEYAVLYLGFQFLKSVISGKKLVWKSIPEGNGVDFIKYVLICLLVDITILLVLELIHELTNSRAFGIVMAVILSSTLLEQLVHGIVELLQSSFGILKDFHVGQFLMIENISGGYKGSDYYPQAILILGLIYISLCTILSVTVLRKKDIR